MENSFFIRAFEIWWSVIGNGLESVGCQVIGIDEGVVDDSDIALGGIDEFGSTFRFLFANPFIADDGAFRRVVGSISVVSTIHPKPIWRTFGRLGLAISYIQSAFSTTRVSGLSMSVSIWEEDRSKAASDPSSMISSNEAATQ